ncbi:neuromedin-U receptor 2-like isoform X2 [Eriocheir sinensis]|uniref:neuromedin-U receptor 2-like isoform X2 n=1 Tax=Eriocheir sinensis TaxID=95602 RepID=UPI0021C78B30|nr:neuromedin-U receptor 2-like isoform X2 [Eriocheir sinensis]
MTSTMSSASTSASPSPFMDLSAMNVTEECLVEVSTNSSLNETFDVCSYIMDTLGEPRLRYSVLLPMTVVYCVIAVGGAVGNVLTCLVVAKNRTMRTSTNYYLVNLAVADLLTLFIALPLEVYQMWVQYPWPWGESACRLRAMMPELVTHVSVLTILAVSGERYVAITNPVYARTTHTLARTARVLPVIWLLSLVAAVPWGYYYQVNHLKDPLGVELPQSSWCAIPYHITESSSSWLIWLSSVGAFILPMTILIFLYCRIGVVLSMDPPTRTPTAGNGAIHTRRMGIRMLAVVVAFFLCWAPFHAQRLMFGIITSKDQWTETLRSINTQLYCFTGTCYYLNSAINPLLYSVMSIRFRNALRRSLCGGRDWARRQQLYFSNTTHGQLQLSNNSNILLRTREYSLTSSRRLNETSNRNGVHYGFENMDMDA